jgi:hypothetical protein
LVNHFDIALTSTIDVASAWLRDCVTNHQGTCFNNDESRLPNRVLAIGAASSEIRLVETNNSQGRYACLSHCWGDSQLLTTTKATLEANEPIEWHKLPRTFQDAIQVARSLGLEYLWIDSLCIVQDDKDDWVRESKEMCAIYENSYLTIAATGALNATAGLFLKEKRSHEISGTTLAGVDFRFISWRTEHMHPSIVFDKSYEFLPLLTRAWVFQERMLSPRFLHFGKTELILECRNKTRCECEYPEHHDLTDHKREHHATFVQPTTADLVQRWHGLVESYCPLNLSFCSDKLPALSGLARQMAKERPQAEYLAGLWSDSLEVDLLWMNYRCDYSGLRLPIPMPTKWQAPSWSWASTNAMIDFPLSTQSGSKNSSTNATLEMCFTIRDAQTDLATEDPTGQVQRGSITITGRLFQVEFVEDGWPQYIVTPDNHLQFALAVNNSGTITQGVNDQNRVHFDFPANPLRRSGVSIFNHGGIKCLHMARIRFRYYQGRIEHEEYAMVVEQLSSTNSYQRIGMVFLTRYLEDNEENWEHPERAWERQPSPFTEGGVLETITIV